MHGIAFILHVQGHNPVHTEMAWRLALLTPRNQHAHMVEEAKGKRPNGALALAILQVAIANE